MGNVLKPLAKTVLILLGLTAVAATTDAAIYKKVFGSGTRPSVLALFLLDSAKQTTLIISNKEMNDIVKVIKSLEQSALLIKGVSKKIKNEAKEQVEDFLECC